jgi:putative membrane protein
MLGLTSWLVSGFSVDGFWTAVGGAIVIGIVNWALGGLLGEDDPRRPRST